MSNFPALEGNKGFHDQSPACAAQVHRGSASFSRLAAGGLVMMLLLVAAATVCGQAPVILAQPQAENVFLGDSATFTVTLTPGASEPLTYQWRKNGTNLPANSRIIGTDQAGLTIPLAQLEDAGAYSVVVANHFGAGASSEAALSVSVVAVLGEFLSQANIPPTLTNVVAVATGYAHNLALGNDGTVATWWSDSFYESSFPYLRPPSNLRNVAAVAVGDFYDLASRVDGTVVAWGSDSGGHTNIPVGLTNVLALAAGQSSSLALRMDGTVVSWGSNSHPEVTAELSNVVGIASDGYLNVACCADGTVVVWGDGTAFSSPSVVPGLSNVVAIATQQSDPSYGVAGLALLADGTVVDWQSVSTMGERYDRISPTGRTNILAIAASLGPFFSVPYNMALQADGTVSSWDQIGLGFSSAPFGLSNVVDIVGGWSESLALIGTGAPFILTQPPNRSAVRGGTVYFRALATGVRPLVYQWQFEGTDLPGATNVVLALNNVQPAQTGDYSVRVSNPSGTITSRRAHLSMLPARITTQPQTQTAVLGGNVEISVDVQSFVPIRYQWRLNGTNISGATNATLLLSNLTFAANGSYSVVVSNAYGTLTSSETHLSVVVVAAWRNNSSAQTVVPGDLTDVSGIAAGYYHSLALRADGTVAAWGGVEQEQTNVPPGLTDVRAIAAGNYHSLALRTDHTVVSWGSGQTNVPAAVSNIVAIAGGGDQSLALRTDGSVIAWNSYSGAQTQVPTGLNNVVAIAASANDSLALRADGTVVQWPDSRDNLVALPPDLTSIVAISAGLGYSLALRADGTVVEWSANGYGQTNVPTGLSDVVRIAAGPYHSLALRADGTVIGWGNSYEQAGVSAGLTHIVAIAAGSDRNLALAGHGVPFIAEMTDRFAPVGGTVYFQSMVTGALPLSYQWRLGGTNIPGATNALLVLTNVQPAQSGDYSIAVGNPLGTATSPGAHLSLVPVWITSPPREHTALLGGGTEFSLEIQSFAPVAYQWRFNGVAIAGATNAALQLTNLTFATAGLYSVVVSNTHGLIASQEARLSVVPVAAWGDNFYGQTNVPANLTNVVALAASGLHNLALLDDGTVRAWGADYDGQLAVPAGLTNVVAVSARAYQSLALLQNGKVVPWGGSSAGETNGPAGLSNVLAVASGLSHNLALRADGTVAAWGYLPTVPAALSNVVAIARGASHSLALRADGGLVAWGDNDYLAPTNIPSGLNDVVGIAADGYHNIALRANGTVVSWDRNGLEDDMPSSLTNVVAVAAGWRHGMALKKNGSIVAWGDNYYGQTNPPAGLTNVAALAAGDDSSLALIGYGRPTLTVPLTDRSALVGGTVYFRANASGAQPLSYQWRLNGTNLPNATNAVLALTNVLPGLSGGYSVMVRNPLGTVTSRSASLSVIPLWLTAQPESRTPVLGGTATLTVGIQSFVPTTYQWRFNGLNLAGATNAVLELGNLTFSNSGSYSVLLSNAYGTVTSSAATLSVEIVAAWGNNESAQTVVPSDLTNVVAISCGDYHNIALRPNGTVVGWGSSNSGQEVVPNLTNVAAIASGAYHNLALQSNGSVVAWGDNGQLLVPGTLTNVIAVAAGGFHDLALRADGSMVAWGNNADGINRIPPGLKDVAAIAAGRYHSLALRTDGTVVAWGENYNSNINLPPGLTNIVSIACGQYHSLALRSDGFVISWGGYSTVPPGLSNVIAIAGGSSHSLALNANGTVVAWGDNTDGQTDVPTGLSNVVAIAGGWSHSLALVGNGRPWLGNRLLDRMGLAGGAQYFRTVASGVSPLSYQWQRDGGNLPNATNSFLAVTNAQPLHSGNYSVRVSNSLGVVTSLGAHLSIAPAYFTVQPADQVILNGENALFATSLASSAPLGFQWRRDGIALAGATNPVLNLNGVTFASAGGYSMVASNTYGAVTSAVATLTVWQPLELAQEGRGTVMIEPGPYTFGDIVVVSATAARFAGFARWADGNTDNTRSITIGVTNRYTAIFTNTVPLERWTNQLDGQVWEVPRGTPRIYVDGHPALGGRIALAETSAPVWVQMETSFDPEYIFYTLDDSPPETGLLYDGPFLLSEPAFLRAVSFDGGSPDSRSADPVTIEFLPSLNAWSRGGGEVGIEPRSAAYSTNALVTLTAMPSNGWVFMYWAGDAGSTNPVLDIRTDRTKSIEAVFGKFLTNVAVNGGGEVIREPADGPYPFGSAVRLSAEPDTNKYFIAWLDGGNALTNSSLRFTVTNANQNLRALFGTLPLNTVSLTVRIDGDGSVSRSPERANYTNGTNVILTATPANSNRVFIGWSGQASGTQNPLSVLLNTNKTIVAHFVSTIAPMVSLATPANNATFGAPATIPLNASASDSDGSIVQVNFLAGTNVLAGLTQRPFGVVWTNVPVGVYTLTAVAYDKSGLRATSAPVVITVNTPAKFHFAQANYQIGEGDGTVTVSVVNEGVQGGLVNYALVDVTAKAGLNGAGDYEYTQGSLEFTNGEAAQSITIDIHDDYTPEANKTFQVRLTNPSEGAALQNPSVAMVTIVDNDGSALTNSLRAVVFPDPAPVPSGRLRVNATPLEAGGQWRFPWELGWRETGIIVSNAPGNYDLEFRPVNGWELLARTMRVTLIAGRTIETTNEYYHVGLSPQGALMVNLGPSDPAITTNAGWRLAQAPGDWLPSGAMLTNLPVGLHLIEFKSVRGWSPPSRRVVEIFQGTSTPPVTENYLLADSLPEVTFPVPLAHFADIDGGLVDDPQLPFAFCGQLRSEVGYGSGVAVRDRVVLTAAHLVYNDLTLSWAREVNWFFQKHEGEFDPKPLQPRGVHMLSGYAAARTGLLPGQSSTNSRNWDVAALYFWASAARHGQSGYLTSDTETNEWLVSSSKKMLIGYPVDGASFGRNEIQPGKMHWIEGYNYAFRPESSRVYLTTEFLSFPGNSGGPLCVEYDNHSATRPYYTYYPAGIYLGSVGAASVVRSIDREVVSLILQAADDAEQGNNYNGGGVFPFGVPNLPGLRIGYLQVTLQPPCAAEAGAKWWVEGDTNLFSTAEPVAAIEYTYTIRFAAVPGYGAPGNQTVTILDRQTNGIVATYRPLQGASLRVNLGPAEAVRAGARWFFDDESNSRVSGDLLSVAPCEHLVSFTPMPGYEVPAVQHVTLTYGRTNVLTMNYRRLPVLSLMRGEGPLLTLRVNGSLGATYVVQTKPDLSPNGVWTNLLTNTLAHETELILRTFQTREGSRFYRVVLQP